MKIRKCLWFLLAVMVALPLSGETWYVRKDGGTRYSAKMPVGQCDGKGDAAYPGKGTNQRCAFNDYRFLWDDLSYGNSQWIIAGGDTVLIRGCAPGPWNGNTNQCRVGFDAAASVKWCNGGNGPYDCTNPTIPSGTAAQPTRILGQNYASCATGNATDKSKLTQIFGGFGVIETLNLKGARNVVVQCIEITEHNGRCILHGSPAYPSYCNNSGARMSDYDGSGIATNDKTANIFLQDVSIHGHTTSGIQGPIGGAIKLNRVNVSFNGFAGWNFDDGNSTPDAPKSSVSASYVTMIGNGCNEEYPIVDAFPAMSCYDLSNGGFGDSWSGQDTTLASLVCDHCVQAYNTKDGFIGPHTLISFLKITNSSSYGNMGQQWKWGATPNSTTIFENNLTVGNCMRMSQPIPGAPSTFNQHLGLYCRASGDMFSFYSAPNSTLMFANNTIVGYSATMIDLNCQPTNMCGSTKYIFRNNIMLGYLNPRYNSSGPNVPGLFYLSDPSDKVTAEHNLYFNLRSRCLMTGNICSDPLFANEPARTMTQESALDNFNFHLRAGSAAIGAGIATEDVLADYFGAKRPTPPSVGAVEP